MHDEHIIESWLLEAFGEVYAGPKDAPLFDYEPEEDE